MYWWYMDARYKALMPPFPDSDATVEDISTWVGKCIDICATAILTEKAAAEAGVSPSSIEASSLVS